MSLTDLMSWFMMRRTNPDVAIEQMHGLRRQVPFLYALLIVNGWAVAYTHYEAAPAFLTLGVIALLSAICGIRMVAWLLPQAGPVTAGQAVRQLRRTTFLAGLLAVAFVIWSLALDRYGGPYERGHVALFIAVTVIGCIFCLGYLPQAALLVTVSVTIPYLAYYFRSGEPVFIAVAINIALVTLVMVQVLITGFRNFTLMVESRAELAVKQAEAQLLSDDNARLAHTDSLTGLPNRRYFFARLEELIRSRARSRAPFLVGVIDLDRFKPVNDTYGHAFGDRLLAEMGQRLRAMTGPDLAIARLGGDEFGLIFTGDSGQAEALGQKVCALVREPIRFEDVRVSLGCSCGLAIYPDAGTTAHALFDRSDYALYHVKSRRTGGTALFSFQHETLIRSERAIEAALQAADIDAEMTVHFQPIVDIAQGIVTGVEALARWNSPTLGEVPPDQFIGIAERVGMIHNVTLTLFAKALRLAEALPPGVGLSFNLSAHDIASPTTIQAVAALARASAIPAAAITFELTETAAMRDLDMAVATLDRLRDLGARIALDDFGTGYSSLSYLRQLPLDRIKIDRSFVADLGESSRRNIVSAIFGLCANLGLDCIAEGIESEEQLAQVRDLGCRMAQGYLFARPMPMARLRDWLADGGTGYRMPEAPVRALPPSGRATA
jgi:diguanylate cyclase (GGDEF)-like protein